MTSKKKITSWKKKDTYTILAPESFDLQPIGTTFAQDTKSLMGRTVDLSLADLTRDRSKQHLKLVFEVFDVKEKNVHTKFKSFTIPAGYLRSKVRRGMGKIDYVSNLKISDSRLRVSVTVLSNQKITVPQKKDMTGKIVEVLDKYSSEKLDQFVSLVLSGKIGTEVYHKIKKIRPVTRVEVWDIRVLP